MPVNFFNDSRIFLVCGLQELVRGQDLSLPKIHGPKISQRAVVRERSILTELQTQPVICLCDALSVQVERAHGTSIY